MKGTASSFMAGYVAWGVGYVAFVVGGLGLVGREDGGSWQRFD